MLVCSHCRHPALIRVGEGVSFYFHWVGDVYCIDVVYVVDGVQCVLYGERYARKAK